MISEEEDMKKVGILSMQNVDNYGSYWQAYSLKSILEELSFDVYFINIRPGEQIVSNPYQMKLSFSKIKRIPYYLYELSRKKMYKSWRSKSFKTIDESECDSIVIGSDEVFNCKQPSPWGFTLQLYGDVNCSNIITYAASFGYTDYDFICEKKIRDLIGESLSRIKHISVRDENSKEIVNRILGINSMEHLDPVLINSNLGYKNTHKRILKRDYILIYSYDFKFDDTEYINKIKEIAKAENLMIVAAGFYQNWVDKNIIGDPEKILSLFEHARYVITDTFHGTIFSIKHHKRFATIVRERNKQKLGDLLHRVKLESQKVDSEKKLRETLSNPPDYNAIEELLEKEREKSINYLGSCIRE